MVKVLLAARACLKWPDERQPDDTEINLVDPHGELRWSWSDQKPKSP
jgi:hypothetical protein